MNHLVRNIITYSTVRCSNAHIVCIVDCCWPRIGARVLVYVLCTGAACTYNIIYNFSYKSYVYIYVCVCIVLCVSVSLSFLLPSPYSVPPPPRPSSLGTFLLCPHERGSLETKKKNREKKYIFIYIKKKKKPNSNKTVLAEVWCGER